MLTWSETKSNTIMSNNTGILDALVQAQSKSVENLKATSLKIKDLMGDAKALEKSVEVYKEWYKTQETITKEMGNAVKGQVINDKTPDFIKQWIETQEKFSQSWMDAFTDLTKNLTGEKMLDTYKENFDKMFGIWKKGYDQFTGMFTTTFGLKNYDLSSQAKEMHDNFAESARTYIKMLDEQIEKAKKTFETNTTAKKK